jgi:gamma-glutamyltranspeptidase/glutathione hydrolase
MSTERLLAARLRGLGIAVLVGALAACAGTPPRIAPAGGAPPAATPHTASPSAPARPTPSGAVISTAHFAATDAGHAILAQGGNAFDAAVAVSAALSVVEPVSSGIGGGGFFLLHDAASGRDVLVDARETAPASANPAMYLDAKGELDTDKAQNGPTSAGIPGLPAALVHVAAKYGRLPLSASLAPAIRLAREGFEVYPRLVNTWGDRAEVMLRYEGTRKVFLADGDPPELGETFRQPELARTLERISRDGRDGFYRGPVAEAMLADVRKYGGAWTAADLASYTVKEREPLRIRYRDWELVTAGPPSSGGIVIAEVLQVLEGWDLAKLDEAERVHRVTEAMRRAYRDRGLYLGDPDFVTNPVAELTGDAYAATLRASIVPGKATPSATLAPNPVRSEGVNTTHFSIIDAEGNFAAVTQTVNLGYGSGMVVDGGGFLLNDEMDDFALRPGTLNAFGLLGYDANAVAPGKRMLSSMAPTFMLGRDQAVVIGGKGGSRIITMVLLGLLGVEQGMDPAAIAAMPRYHHQYLPDTLSAEPGALSPDVAAALRAMGHVLKEDAKPWTSYVHVVDWNRRTGVVRGGADPRNPTGSAKVVPAARKMEARAAAEASP